MDFITGHIICCFILSFVVTLRGDCPKSCDCYSESKTVDCIHGYWKKFPYIPNGTTRVYIESGKGFGTLKRPTSCSGYSHVTKLVLKYNDISSIANNAFSCMPELQSLTILNTFVQRIPEMKNLPSLQIADLQYNNLTVKVFSSLCNVKTLEKINLYNNKMLIGPADLECLTSLTNLSHVDLSFNTISGPVHKVLEPLQHVSKNISLVKCGISSLTDDTFAGFHVETLDLSFNMINYVPKNTFKNLTNLKTLILNSCGIRDTHEWLSELPLEGIYIMNNMIMGLPTLTSTMRKANIGGNDIYELRTGSFHNLHNLVELRIPFSKISVVQKRAFYNLSSLELLDLGGNEIGAPDFVRLLLNLFHTPLKTLILSFSPLYSYINYIRHFHPNTLVELYVSYCRISNIEPNTFKDFEHLEVLDLSGNHITYLTGAFKNMRNLKQLNLEYNPLQHFDARWSGLWHTPLVELRLSKSRDIQYVSVQQVPTLLTLDLSAMNDQFSLHVTNLISLTRLDLSRNRIRQISVKVLANLPNLTFLDLYGNTNFLDDFPDTLQELELKNLKTLNLSKVEFGHLRANQQLQLWSKASQLRYLIISGCKILTLNPGMFQNLSNLQLLDASANDISVLEPSTFLNLINLQKLILDSNSISHVNWESFVNLPHLRLLSLARNPLFCTCEILWISQAVKTPDLVYMANEDELQCQNQQNVQGIKVEDLDLKIPDCEDKQVHLVIISFGATLVSILVLLVAYAIWHYRWHVRYTLFLARAGRGRYKDMHDNREYVYDAFVAYSGADLSWVRKHLLPGIDVTYTGPGGFKLCLHHRDWLVGVDIAENIVKSIAESRRTILILSKEFAKSYWCRFELATAHMKLDAEGYGIDRLLVILLDDIPANLLNARIIHILTLKTYLAWPQDPEERPMFWKTLHKSLRREHLYNV